MESLARSIGLFGAHGQRDRMLCHHIPLAIANVGLIVLFTMLPLFDVNEYEHADLMREHSPRQERLRRRQTRTRRGMRIADERLTSTEATIAASARRQWNTGMTPVQPNYAR